MKINAFSFLFLLLFLTNKNSLLSQNTFGLKINAGNSYRLITAHQSDIYKNRRNDKETSKESWDVELNYNQVLNKNLSLVGGIGYTGYGYQYLQKILDPCYSTATCGYTYETHQYSFSYLKIPLRLSSNFWNKKFIFEIGTSALFPINRKYKWVVRHKKHEFWNQSVAKKEPTEKINPIGISFDLNIGYAVRVNHFSKIKLMLGGNIVLNSFENSHIERRLYLIGLLSDENTAMQEKLFRGGIGLEYILDLN